MSTGRDTVGAAILVCGVGFILAFAWSPAQEWVGIPATIFFVVAVSACTLALHWRWLDGRDRGKSTDGDDAFSDPGVSIEVDCRACGKFNRVPGHRLRDRPKCGQCKARLMPGKRVVFCRVRPMEGVLRRGVNALWTDEDQLWGLLADHVAMENKVRAEAVQSPKTVN